VLADNSFTSTLPPSLSQLTNLQFGYFFRNSFSGSFPFGVTSLVHLKYLYLSYNQLTGTIPPEIGQLSDLLLLSLESNQFHASLPSEIGLLSSLQFLDLSMNLFSGNVPTLFGALSSLKILNLTANHLSGSLNFLQEPMIALKSLHLSSNCFIGSLPSAMSTLTSLEFVQLDRNQLDGEIPTWIGDLDLLESFDLSMNHFTGSIPSTLSNLKFLVYFDISLNSFSSSLPSDLIQLSRLQLFIAEDCQLSGILPSGIGSMISLRSLRLKKNQVIGTIPESIGSLSQLQLLDLSENKCSGWLPGTLNQLSQLKYLLLPNNLLQGNLETLVSIEFQKSILTIDISNNAFTGTLPMEIFAVSSLQYFAAAVNCLDDTLHPLICNASNLEVLALDGIGATRDCQKRYWSNTFQTYGLLKGLRGTIPTCLFEMNKLKTLHLSGNLITGSLSSQLNISTHLQDFSVSHNLLTGSIPLKIQEREWINLDLSFNKFFGSLSSKFSSYPPTSSLRLLVNRLSGKVPYQVQQASNVSVLDGNLFECDLYHQSEGLPVHDPATEVYQCANSFEQLSYTWISPYLFLIVVALIGLCILTVWKSWYERVYAVAEEIDKSLAILDKQFTHGGRRTSSILLFKKFLIDWQVTCLYISLCHVFLILPVWVVMTQFYNTYEFEYSWSASVAYLSGLVPSIIALVMFTFLLAIVFSLSTTNIARHQSRRISNFVPMKSSETLSQQLLHYGVLVMILFINCLIVIGVNVLYLLATTKFNKTIVTLCAVSLGLFSSCWNVVILTTFEGLERILIKKSITTDALQRCQHRHVITQSIIGLFNNILIPLLSTAAISSTCYYYFFQSAIPIVATFQYTECVIRTSIVYACFVVKSITVCPDVVGSIYQCFDEIPVAKTTTFFPPFRYSYQCSSTFIASYAAVYVYSYMMAALLSPLITYFLSKLRQSLSSQSSSSQLVLVLNYLLPPYLLPINEDFKLGTKLLYRDYFVTTAIIDTAVLITFGAIFPPLSLIICSAIVIRVLCILYPLGSLLSQAEEKSLSQYSQQLLQDCDDIPEIFGKLLWLILPFAALIFSLFILDTYGDVVSWQRALIPTLAMCAVPLFFILLRRIYSHPAVKPVVNKILNQCRRHVPFVNLFLNFCHQEFKFGFKATTMVSRLSLFSTQLLQMKPATAVAVAPHHVSHPSLPGPSIASLACSQVMPFEDNPQDHSRSESDKEDGQRPPVKVSNDFEIEEL
jgi:hypothetical protein